MQSVAIEAPVLLEPNAPSQHPLVVDLDGTLVKSDLLVEAIFYSISHNPRSAWGIFRSALRGKAALKQHLAEQTSLEPSSLPYDEQVMARIRQARAESRPVFLATASSARFGHAVAEDLGLFDGCFTSNAIINLAGVQKAAHLSATFGEGGFDYIGNSRADCPVWHAADTAIGIRVPQAVARRMAREDKPLEMLEASRPTLKTWARQLRIHQYAKNTLVFVPLLTSGQFSLPTLFLAAVAFMAYSLVASSIYIVNDLVDLTADRNHPTKRRRPLASGLIPLHQAMVVSVALLLGGFAIAISVSMPFTLALLAYLVLTTSYSFYLKRKFLIDVVALSLLYTIRVIGGGAIVGIILSEWLLAFSMMIFTCLALTKRYIELTKRSDANLSDAANRDYKIVDMNVVLTMAIAAGYNSITILALYLASPAVHAKYGHPERLWALCPLMLYWTGRILMMAYRRQVADDPVVFALRDWVSRLTLCCVVVILVAAH